MTKIKEKEQLNTIEIHDLIKIYKRKGVETSALRGLTCYIDQGQITVLMGPSGCGKTTLMNIIGGISHPSAGAVIVNHCGVSEYTEEELVSSDIVGTTVSSVFDSKLTAAMGNLLKVRAWYDNEYGYSCRVVDLAKIMMEM